MCSTEHHNTEYVRSPLKTYIINRFTYPLSTYYLASGRISDTCALRVACASALLEEAGLSQQQQQLLPVLSFHDATVKSETWFLQVEKGQYSNTQCTENIRDVTSTSCCTS